jgi:hypothetical protein
MAEQGVSMKETLEMMRDGPVPYVFGPGLVLYLAAACKQHGVEWPEVERHAQRIREAQGNA